MKFYKQIWILLVLALIVACDEEDNSMEIGTDPEIISARIQSGWNLLSENPVAVEATVKDPQGIPDITTVTVTVQDEGGTIVFSDSLLDDGSVYHPEAGDVFARDGVFRNQFLTASISQDEGLYRFILTASDKEGHLSNTYEKVVQFGFNELPVITGLSGSDSLPSGGESQLYAAVFDGNGTDEVEKVFFDLYRDSDKLTVKALEMANDGDFDTNGDLFAGDSIYSYRLDSSFAAGRKGWYDLHFSAVDGFEEPGPEAIREIYLENEAGSIKSVSKPDRIQKPDVPFNPSDSNTYNRALIEVRVSDPQGLADVDSVYFFSRKPDGELAGGGEPFILLDNGRSFNINNLLIEAGDKVEGDGTYSFTIIIYNDPSTLLGTYIWSFYMRDRVGNLTPVTVDSIEVYQ